MRKGSTRRIHGFLILVAMTVVCAGAAPAADRGERGAAAERPDPWITMKTKIGLLTTECVSGTDINVDTQDGRVTLHGKVESQAEKAKAAEIAMEIEGVRSVRNLIQVVPSRRNGDAMETTAENDERIEERVEDVLENDRALDRSRIYVKSVNRGVVLLGGRANNLREHLRAIEDARSVPGVRRVHSEVETTEDQRAEDEEDRYGRRFRR